MSSYIDQIPVVYQTLGQFPTNILKNTFILACQHLLTDTRYLLLSLRQLGLSSENIAIIGKCYSTNLEVVQEIRSDGFEVFVPPIDFDSHLSFDEQFGNHITNFIKNQLAKRDFSCFENVIILDDGGELIIKASEIIQNRKKIIGVEQTSSGFHRARQAAVNIPVINVARCKSKLNIESPIIARIILERLDIYLAKKNMTPKKWLIIGNGPIGQSLYQKLLVRGTDGIIYDLDANKSEINQNKFKYYLKNADVILGCTGFTSVEKEYHNKLKKGVILASASSSDREFDAVHLRRLDSKINKCHVDSVINDIHLLNSGFPINFFGGKQSTPLYERQLTMSLLLSGVCQAKKIPRNSQKFINLDPRLEEYILKNFEEKYAKFYPEENNLGVRIMEYDELIKRKKSFFQPAVF